MPKDRPGGKKAWKTIFIFLAITAITSSIFHNAIVHLYPSSIYIGALMWCPALAAFVTLKLTGRSVSTLNWHWGNWKYIRLSYFVPACYALLTYLLLWVLGFGGLASGELVLDWARELGLMGIGVTHSGLSGNHRFCLIGNCWRNTVHGNDLRGRNRMARVFYL